MLLLRVKTVMRQVSLIIRLNANNSIVVPPSSTAKRARERRMTTVQHSNSAINDTLSSLSSSHKTKIKHTFLSQRPEHAIHTGCTAHLSTSPRKITPIKKTSKIQLNRRPKNSDSILKDVGSWIGENLKFIRKNTRVADRVLSAQLAQLLRISRLKSKDSSHSTSYRAEKTFG
ncbi:hypothetical protein RvY_17681 [Ramazzottius varieornatus]|uniref:Uncharacterized protein n=1 Tax=Ramazzottius varieornatus TaxID=947166 RepID=A0A1D1W379_RAMVA|nr:hypothetical protein RvY_17681 [Ramazzottius varieornatus]